MDPRLQQANTESSNGTPLAEADVPILAAAYLNSVVRPAGRTRRPFILCPVGLVGSGKSTVMRLMAERFGLARVSGDEIRAMLKDRGYSLTRVLDISAEVVRTLLAEGHGIAIDSDCAAPHVRKALEGFGLDFGRPLVYVHVTAPDDVIMQRNRVRDGGVEKQGGAVADYIRRKPLHEALDFPFVFTFDTSRDDFEEQMENAQAAIESALTGSL